MKKIIALFTALIMVMTMCSPAFAQDLTGRPGASGEVTITTGTKDADGNDAEWYIVTIPADTVIPWRQVITPIGYSIQSQLRYNHRVQVEVSGNYAMKSADGEYSILYALVGDTSYTTTQPTIVEPDERNLNVLILRNVWEFAIVEEYSDILTYSAGIVTVEQQENQ